MCLRRLRLNCICTPFAFALHSHLHSSCICTPVALLYFLNNLLTIFPMDKTLQKKMEEKGVYFTHLVKELINTLIKANKPLSIQEILKAFGKAKFFPYRSSLYRQLLRLSKLSFVEESIFSDGVKRYCFIYEMNHHHHFECGKCGYIRNIPMKKCEDISSDVSKNLKRSGHKITSHSFTLKGFCPKCA
jgi:Fe2+ or Zn2+ uptake regulation protein